MAGGLVKAAEPATAVATGAVEEAPTPPADAAGARTDPTGTITAEPSIMTAAAMVSHMAITRAFIGREVNGERWINLSRVIFKFVVRLRFSMWDTDRILTGPKGSASRV